MSVYRNNRHICDRVPFTYCKITSYKSTINIMNWNYTVSADIVKVVFPDLNIATIVVIIVSLTIKSFSLIFHR